jgi:hypothetical protein
MRTYCAAYGHGWSRNMYVTQKLPRGYEFEKCKHCGETRTKYAPGVGSGI